VNGNGAVVLYENQNLLAQLAQEHGMDIEAYQRKVNHHSTFKMCNTQNVVILFLFMEY